MSFPCSMTCSSGVPLEIPYESSVDGAPCFSGLVKTYSGDMAPRPMLKELVRVGAVIELENNTYKAVQRAANVISIGPMLQGLRKPVNDLSRGALVDDIVYTIAITAIQADT